MKLGELASRLGAELRGDPELEVTGVKGIEDAGPSEITFVANPKYGALARKTKLGTSLSLDGRSAKGAVHTGEDGHRLQWRCGRGTGHDSSREKRRHSGCGLHRPEHFLYQV